MSRIFKQFPEINDYWNNGKHINWLFLNINKIAMYVHSYMCNTYIECIKQENEILIKYIYVDTFTKNNKLISIISFSCEWKFDGIES